MLTIFWLILICALALTIILGAWFLGRRLLSSKLLSAQAPPSDAGLVKLYNSFPPANEALNQPDFRIAGVYFWQGNWTFNFWSNLKPNRLGEDLERLRKLHFNTILLTMPWGLFQPTAFPPTYNEKLYERLAVLLEAAAEQQLYVILRLGTPDHIPSDIDGTNYYVPKLLLSDRYLEAYYDLFRETARRLRGHPNVLFLFFSWEDLQSTITSASEPLERRLALARETETFYEYLRYRPLSWWNRCWGTDYRSWPEAPIPAKDSIAFRDLLLYSDARLLNNVLPSVARAVREGSDRLRLSYEVRVDGDPWLLNGKVRWFDHRSSWDLPSGYHVLSTYFNPYWNAPDENGHISVDDALANLRRMLNTVSGKAANRPVFITQLNITDSTPTLSSASQLRNEWEAARFLDGAMSLLYKRTLGYALWCLDAYEANLLYNSSFEIGLDGWEWEPREVEAGGLAVERDPECGELYLSMAPRTQIAQSLEPSGNPGSCTPEAPFTFRVLARASSAATLTLIYEIFWEDEWQERSRHVFSLESIWKTYEVELPFPQVRCRVRLVAGDTAPVDVDELSLFNYVQTDAVFGAGGDMADHRAEVLQSHHWDWMFPMG